MKSQKIRGIGIKKKPGFLYFVDMEGDVSCYEKKTGKRKKIVGAGVPKEKGWLYFIDKEGDISRVKRKGFKYSNE